MPTYCLTFGQMIGVELILCFYLPTFLKYYYKLHPLCVWIMFFLLGFFFLFKSMSDHWLGIFLHVMWQWLHFCVLLQCFIVFFLFFCSPNSTEIKREQKTESKAGKESESSGMESERWESQLRAVYG